MKLNFFLFVWSLLASPIYLACSLPNSAETVNSREDVNSRVAVASQRGTDQVFTVCEVMKDPELYSGQRVNLHTTLYRIGSIVSIGDANCIQRHPVVDVEFSQDFIAHSCGSTLQSPELCSFVKDGADGRTDVEITADFAGYLDYYLAQRGFSFNGHRFKFVVDTVSNIDSIRPVPIENEK